MNQKTTIIVFSFLAFLFAGLTAFTQATYRSKIAGNWNQPGTWLLLAGSDSDLDGVPDANDTVIVRYADVVTLTADASCINLTIQNLGSPIVPTSLAIGNYTLQLTGTLNGPNATFKTNIITTGTGRLKFIGGSRALFGPQWNGFAPDNWRVEVALNAGATGTSTKSIKVGDFILTSGNFEIRSSPATYVYLDLKIDKGAALGNGNGTLYIAPGSKLSCMRCGQRTGDTTAYSDISTYCQSIDIYGELEVHGAYLSGQNINVHAGGKLIIARSNSTAMATSPTGVSNFAYSPGSYLEYKNHSPASVTRTQTGAEIDQATSWNTSGPPGGNTVSNIIVNNSPFGIRGNNVIYIEDTCIMTYGYFDNVDMTGAYVRYGTNGSLKYNCPTAVQNAAISHLSIEFQPSFGPYNLIIDNPYGVVLDYSRTINGKLCMQRGRMTNFNVNVYLTLGAGASVGAVSDSSFISAKMAKAGSTTFTFPIGKNNQYRPITVAPVSGTETYTAEYFKTDPNTSFNTMNKDLTLNHISRCEYWTLVRTGTKDANVSLSWNTYSCGVDSLNDLRVSQWDGTKWKDRSASAVSGNSTSGTINAGNIITQFGATFPFALASATQFNPLPVELISFEAKPFKDHTLLIWETASEKNSDYFQLERSSDGINFTEITRMHAAGNSNELINYSFRDKSPITGTSYYRLNEFDLDGTLALSKVIVSKSTNGKNDLQVFTDDNSLIVNFNTENTNEKIPLNIFDINGREVFSTQITGNQSTLFPLTYFTRGFYFARIVSNGNVTSQKFVY